MPVVVPHGNSKSLTPFFPTLPSTQRKTGNQCSMGGPKHVVGTVSKKMGGVLCAKNPYELPRKECQVSYVKQKSKMCSVAVSTGPVSDHVCDQVFAIMQSAKIEDHHDGKFVRDTQPSPEPVLFLHVIDNLTG